MLVGADGCWVPGEVGCWGGEGSRAVGVMAGCRGQPLDVPRVAFPSTPASSVAPPAPNLQASRAAEMARISASADPLAAATASEVMPEAAALYKQAGDLSLKEGETIK